MANVNYDINYDDSRFKAVESQKTAALNEVDKTYGEMLSQSDKYYQAQIDASKQWADKQTQLQNEKTDFAIKEIEQQKAQAQKDYTREQSGAYVDWQKQSNEYGANAEEMASAGLANTGFSESSQVSMYNTYQNRVATARESYNLAVQNFNNSITEARLQNNSILAEIAYEALQQQLELSLQGFQYKNALIKEKSDKRLQVDSEYYSRYQDVLKQINTENAMAEEVRQYNEKMAEEKRQYNESLALQKEQFAWQKEQAAKKSSGGSHSGSGGSGGSKSKSQSTIKSNKNQTIKKNNTSSALPKATAKSIMALGEGPLSAASVAKKVAKGEVIEAKNKTGDTVFVKNQKQLPDLLFRRR